MKNSLLFTSIALLTTLILKAQIVSEKIGDNPIIINPSAVLEIESNTKGFLPPRMTYIQRNAIVTPTAGLIIRCTNCGTYGELQVYNGSVWTNLYGVPGQNPWNEVLSPITGKYWMDRNLGASQVATSSDDALAFGDLYQWGRSADGHQKRSNTIFNSIPFNSETPENSSFITSTSKNWLAYKNNNLWQGVNGVNNPCPAGFRIPTSPEWTNEINTWAYGNTNITGAFTSPLKLPKAGSRNSSTGGIEFSNTQPGIYWSSTIVGILDTASVMFFNVSNAGVGSATPRSTGVPIRCIKE